MINIGKFLKEVTSNEDSTSTSKELELVWYKFSSPTGFYFSPFIKSKHQLCYYETPKEMAESLSPENSYEVVTDHLVEVYEKATPQTEPESLPNGVYYHEYGSASLPERISPMIIREDKYVELMDSLKELDDGIDQFIQNKQIYTDSCSAYKLGILLFGPPGSGKTSYMREFIRKKDAIVIFMDGVPSRKFLEKLETSTKNRVKIVVFEEAVSLLESSEDIREMLDFLDGSKSLTNTIYFLSTNYPESIPENIVRNGRIDIFVRVDYPNINARKKLISLYLKREASEEELTLTENLPIVDIREICFSHKKTSKSFKECVKIIEDKNKMLKKHFGKSKEIRLA
jgi:signal recognition particle receptor subunit beta